MYFDYMRTQKDVNRQCNKSLATCVETVFKHWIHLVVEDMKCYPFYFHWYVVVKVTSRLEHDFQGGNYAILWQFEAVQ